MHRRSAWTETRRQGAVRDSPIALREVRTCIHTPDFHLAGRLVLFQINSATWATSCGASFARHFWYMSIGSFYGPSFGWHARAWRLFPKSPSLRYAAPDIAWPEQSARSQPYCATSLVLGDSAVGTSEPMRTLLEGRERGQTPQEYGCASGLGRAASDRRQGHTFRQVLSCMQRSQPPGGAGGRRQSASPSTARRRAQYTRCPGAPMRHRAVWPGPGSSVSA